MAGNGLAETKAPTPGLIAGLHRERPMAMLLLVSFVLASALVLTALPVGFVLGTSAFWDAPSGIPFRGPPYDVSQALIGYTGFLRAPWGWPLLQVPLLVPPDGTNIFWLDAVPSVALLGKLLFSLTGWNVNLLGAYHFACLVLPGVAMTCVLAVAGQRTLLAAIGATIFAGAAPFLWFRWGNPPHHAHFLVVFAIALYLASHRGERPLAHGALWLALLTISLLTNLYLFVMVGGFWAAMLLQRLLDRSAIWGLLVLEAVVVCAALLMVMLAMGILSADLRHGAAVGFGLFSMNLASPFMPQMSGVFPWLEQFRIGMPYQYEGFAYLGFGALLMLSFSLQRLLGWLCAAYRVHGVLICVLFLFTLFALSHHVFLGTTEILYLPLPDHVVALLGTFRSSGRFFWPVAYALIAASLLLILRTRSPRLAVRLVVVACVLQLIDIQPLRRAVAASAGQARADAFDRTRIAALVQRADAVLVYPSWYCIEDAMEAGTMPFTRRDELHLPDLDIQLAAARAGRAVNSVYVARRPTDCAAEGRAQAAPLRQGTVYFYPTGYVPESAQLGGRSAAEVCASVAALRYCVVP